MTGGSSPHEPLVLCPLRFERDLLRRAGVSASFAVCGPGAGAVRRWAAGQPRHRLWTVALAGLAGGLSEEAAEGTAWVVTEVLDAATGRRWRPSWAGVGHPPCLAVSSVAAAGHPREKTALRLQTGAMLVDQESAEFAEAATRAGWCWAVVRGISDGPATALPAGAGSWIRDDGGVRPAALLASLLRQPRLLPRVIRLRCSSRSALSAVAGKLSDLLRGPPRG